MIDKFYKKKPRDILKRKIGANQLLKKVERGFQNFLSSPYEGKKI